MLLKDLEIDIKDHGVFCFTQVIIKREDKFYAVAVNSAYETKSTDITLNKPTKEFITESINHFMDYCKKTDQNWKIDSAKRAERSGDTGRQIMEFEIEL